MTVTSTTPGKLILLGEYAVLEGAPALVKAVNLFANITIKESQDNLFYISAPNLNLKDIKFNLKSNQALIFEEKLNDIQKQQLKLFTKEFEYIYKHLHSKSNTLIPCNISIDTSDFYFEKSNQKLGLGSSAALTVGLIKSLLKFNNIHLINSDELFQLALQAHFEAQEKTGSGIDIAASTFGSSGIYKKTEAEFSYEYINLPEDLCIIPIWTGSSTSTPQFVSKTKQLKNTNPEKYNRIIKDLSELSIQGCNSLLKDDSKCFLNVIDKFYKSLDELGKNAGIPIISESHKIISEIVKQCNGFYKPSGAGGSDIGIAFTNDLKVKENIIKKINQSQFKYIKLEVAENK